MSKKHTSSPHVHVSTSLYACTPQYCPPKKQTPTIHTHLGLDPRPRQVADQHLDDVRLAARGEADHHQNQLALHGGEAHKVRLERLPARVRDERALVRLLQRNHVRVGAEPPCVRARGEGKRAGLAAQDLVPPGPHDVEDPGGGEGVEEDGEDVIRHRHGGVCCCVGWFYAAHGSPRRKGRRDRPTDALDPPTPPPRAPVDPSREGMPPPPPPPAVGSLAGWLPCGCSWVEGGFEMSVWGEIKCAQAGNRPSLEGPGAGPGSSEDRSRGRPGPIETKGLWEQCPWTRP